MGTNNLGKQRPALLWQGSTLQLLGVIILPLALLVLIFALGGAFAHQQAMRRMIGDRDSLSIGAAANTLSTELYHRMTAMRGLALQASRFPEAPEEVLTSSGYLLADFDRGMALVSSDGHLLAATDSEEFWHSFTNQENKNILNWLDDQVGQDGEINDTFFDPDTKAPLLIVAASSPDGQLFSLGALTVEAITNKLLVSVLPDQNSARILIVNNSENLLFRSKSFDQEDDLSTHPGVVNALDGKNGTIYLKKDDDEYVIAYSPVKPVGWALIMEESWQTVTTPFLRTTEIAPLTLAPLLLISLAGLWFGVRQIVQPLRALETKASYLAWGDFQAVDEPVGGIAEIRQLQAKLSQMAHKVQAAQSSLHGYIGEITEAQEEERRRLARELHDGTIQSLIALKQRVQMVRITLMAEPEKQALKTLEILAEQTIEDLRRTTRALRPIYLEDLGLVTALEVLAREAKETTGIEISFSTQGDQRRLSTSIELALYRIAQEALSNVARHANASQAILSISFRPDSVILKIMDNGVGFQVPTNPGEFAPSGHFGLLGLYERAELIGASLDIRSEVREGTHLTVQLPFGLK